jgi:hypothetical protein
MIKGHVNLLRTMRFRLELALIGLSLWGCSDATGSLQGGEARPLPAVVGSSGTGSGGSGASESGSAGSAGGTGSSGSSPPAATWTNMYALYFGNKNTGGCGSLSLICHQSPGDSGDKVAPVSGFVCGTTAASCYAGMMNATPPLVTAADAADPTKAYLLSVLALTGTTAGMFTDNMPQSGLYTFGPSDISLITQWIQDGAPNN